MVEQYTQAAITTIQNKLKPSHTGVCVQCGDEIESDRLAVYPAANLCILCAEQLEAQLQRKRLLGLR